MICNNTDDIGVLEAERVKEIEGRTQPGQRLLSGREGSETF